MKTIWISLAVVATVLTNCSTEQGSDLDRGTLSRVVNEKANLEYHMLTRLHVKEKTGENLISFRDCSYYNTGDRIVSLTKHIYDNKTFKVNDCVDHVFYYKARETVKSEHPSLKESDLNEMIFIKVKNNYQLPEAGWLTFDTYKDYLDRVLSDRIDYANQFLKDNPEKNQVIDRRIWNQILYGWFVELPLIVVAGVEAVVREPYKAITGEESRYFIQQINGRNLEINLETRKVRNFRDRLLKERKDLREKFTPEKLLEFGKISSEGFFALHSASNNKAVKTPTFLNYVVFLTAYHYTTTVRFQD